MTIAFKVLGYTVASLEVEVGDDKAVEAVVNSRPVNKLVKRVSDAWVRRMMSQ